MSAERMVNIPLPGDFEPVAIYTDGGVDGKNPSPHGGSWAFCYVDATGREWCRSGYITPADTKMHWVSNNHTELYAILMALECWRKPYAILYTDSNVSKLRVDDPYNTRFENIPKEWRDRLKIARAFLNEFVTVLLGGHPTKAELKMGMRRDGFPCSPHNVTCDELCRDEITQARRRRSPIAAVPHNGGSLL